MRHKRCGHHHHHHHHHRAIHRVLAFHCGGAKVFQGADAGDDGARRVIIGQTWRCVMEESGSSSCVCRHILVCTLRTFAHVHSYMHQCACVCLSEASEE